MRTIPRHRRAAVVVSTLAVLAAGFPAAQTSPAAAAPPAQASSSPDDVRFSGRATRPTRALARRPAPTKTTPPSTPSPTPGNTSTPAALLSFASSSFFYDDISAAPLDPNSPAIAKNVARQVSSHWGGVAAFNAHQWNTTFYRVDAKTPRVNVKWSNCLNFDWTPDGIYNGAAVFRNVPVPSLAVSASGSDGAMSIYDAATDTSWEFWQMKKDAAGGWQACQGGRIDKVSQAMGQYPVGFGVSASGLSMAAGTISAAEAKNGRIEHALYLAVVDARHFGEFSWPAVRSDGYTKDPTAPMEGQRLRLDPTVNVAALPISPFAKAVARAAQKYGFIVCDKGGAVALVGEAGQSLKATTGTDPWPAILGGPDHVALQGFPWDRIQALPKDYGKR